MMDLQNEALTTLIERTSILLNQMRSKNNLDSMAVKELEENFLDMNQVIKQMDIDVRGLTNGKVEMVVVLNQFKRSIASLALDYQRLRKKLQRSSLLPEKSVEQRLRYLDVEEKINHQNSQILEAHQSVIASTDIGNEILHELGHNKEKIITAREKTAELQSTTDSIKRTLSSMTRWQAFWG